MNEGSLCYFGGRLRSIRSCAVGAGFLTGPTSGVSAKIAVRSSASTAAYGDMARARTDLVSGVDSAARPEDYRVGASEEIPGTLEAQGEHEYAEKHQLLVALDQAVTQYSLPKTNTLSPSHPTPLTTQCA